ncbi:24296_t:CDS:2, partial [Cetraspora pellucida]
EDDISIDSYSSERLDVISRQNYYPIGGETDTSMGKVDTNSNTYTSTDTYSSNELDVISKQDNDLIFDDQDIFNNQKISNKFNLSDSQKILDQTITCDMIMNKVDELQSDDSKHNNDNGIDSSGFPSVAY